MKFILTFYLKTYLYINNDYKNIFLLNIIPFKIYLHCSTEIFIYILDTIRSNNTKGFEMATKATKYCSISYLTRTKSISIKL